MSIKVLEAFAGIGAQRKALTNIGLDYESVGIIEIDKPAENSYNLYMGKLKTLVILPRSMKKNFQTLTYLLIHFLVRKYLM